eukprot:GILJ01010322.1.p1 GENE.GILJ01010322.1~~GILJ01010322.1.p1  ORF type:complete len:264 (-),score=22.30 GILJ01010322.1:189-947(-)
MAVRAHHAKLLAGAFCIGAMTLFFVFIVSYEPFRNGVLSFAEWLRQEEWKGGLIAFVVLTVAVLVCLPCTFIELLIGFIFGWWGLPISLCGKQIGSVVAFFIARNLLASDVQKTLREFPKIQVIDRALAENQVRMMLVARFMWIPIAIKNYGLSLLNVRFWVYFWCTLVASIPYSVAFMYMGSTAKHLVDVMDGHASLPVTEIVFMVIGIVSIVLFIGIIIFETRKALKQAEEKQRLMDEDAALIPLAYKAM